jgi:hypothetical protein
VPDGVHQLREQQAHPLSWARLQSSRNRCGKPGVPLDAHGRA